MKIAIIETGRPPKPVAERFAHYPAMMERMLSPFAQHFSFDTIPVCDGAPPPGPGEFDGLLITGAPAGVYESHGWIPPLEELIRQSSMAGKPQVGICFGHQIMAQAFGGKVEKSERGWGVGIHDYAVDGKTDWMIPVHARISCVVSHQDQVIEMPPGARRLAGSEFCPNGILAYENGPAISIQMHPEYSHEFAEALINIRRGKIGGDLVAQGVESLRGRSDRTIIAQWIAQFFLNKGLPPCQRSP